MEYQKQLAVRAARRPRLRSVVLFGTALGGVLVGAAPVWAQTSCSTSVDCINNGNSSGLSVAAGASVPALTNTSSGVITVTNASYPGISNSGTVGTLINAGTISAAGNGIDNNGGTIGTLITTGTIQTQHGDGITNSGTIGTLVQSGVITVTDTSYHATDNTGSIGTLVNAGQSTTANDQQITNNTSGTIVNTPTPIVSTGTIGTMANVGVYNQFNDTTITNSGTIDGFLPANPNPGENAVIAAGIYNDTSGTVASLVNTGLLETTGGIPFNTVANTDAYGVDNLGTIVSLTNSGTIENNFIGFGTDSNTASGIENHGDIGTLTNTGSINGSLPGWPHTAMSMGIDNYGTVAMLINEGSINAGIGDGKLFTQTDSIGIENEKGGTIGTLINSGSVGSTYVPGSVGVQNENGGTIGLLVNTGTISAVDNGLENHGSIGTLINTGYIHASNGEGVFNDGTINTLVDVNSITSETFETDISNRGYIGTLVGAGASTTANGQQITNVAGNTISNAAVSSTTVENNGTINTLANVGVYNQFSDIAITNSGTINGFSESNDLGNEATALAAGIYNDSTGDITSLTNEAQALIEGSGSAPFGATTVSGYGIDNLGTIGTLSNLGTIENSLEASGTAGLSYGIENLGDIGTITNSGTIDGFLIANCESDAPTAYGIDNDGNITALNNSGTIESGDSQNGVAINNEAKSIIGTLTNTGLIAGNIPSDTSSGSTTYGIDNSGTIGLLNNNSGTIESGIGGDAIYNEVKAVIGTLSNSGQITSGAQARGIANSGTIGLLDNLQNGTITGTGIAALSNDDIIGTLINAGVIEDITSQGNSTNSPSGILNGAGTIGLLNNSGMINGLDTSVNNMATIGTLINSGTLEGHDKYGLDNSGTIGTLANSGMIETETGASIYNEKNSLIATLSNSGQISNGTNAIGILNDGTIGMLGNSGTIIGTGIAAISNAGTISLLDNSGVIHDTTKSNGNNPSGVLNTAGTIAMLDNSGTITGIGAGVDNLATIGTLDNSGTISGTGAGVNNLGTIGSLDNSGTITGTNYGLDNAGTVGALLNTGTIQAKGADGDAIFNAAGHHIGVLANSGSLTSGQGGSGIDNAGTIATLVNAGDITTPSNPTFINKASGFLTDVPAPTINNTGVIGTLIGAGVYNDFNGATVINDGTITAATITAGGTGTVQTTIIAGVYNDQGGSLKLLNQGDISSSEYGVYNAGTLTTLDNAGTISGPTDALYLAPGSTLGAFTNSGTIAGNIDNETGQTLNIAGAGNGGIGTLTGYDDTTGSITSKNAGLNFTSGALLLNDNITAPSVTDSGADLLVNGNIASSSPFMVNSGILEVGDANHSGASLTDDVDVNDTGILSGQGTIIGNVVNDATVDPNGPTGTLTVNGSYTQNNDGVLNITASPAGTSELVVNGPASLAGGLTLTVTRHSPFQVGAQYTVLQARDITGSGLTFNPAAYKDAFDTALEQYLTPKITTSASKVLLELDPKPQAFLNGHFYPSGLYAQASALQNALTAPLDPLGSAFTVSDGYWIHAVGGFGSAGGSDFNNEGFVAGKGFALSPNVTIGGGISNIYSSSSANGSSSSSTSFGALAYGIYADEHLSVAGSVGAGHIGNNMNRYIQSLGWKAKSASNGEYEGMAVRAQYNLLATDSPYFLAPYVTASYVHTGVGSAQETNAGLLDMRYDGITTNLAQVGGGLRGGYSLPVQSGMLTFWGSLGGFGTLGNPRVAVTETLGRFKGQSSALVAPVGGFTPGLGVELQGNTPWRLSAGWNGQFGSATDAQSFTLQLSAKW